MPTYPGDVSFRGKTGSDRQTVKTTRLTRFGHRVWRSDRDRHFASRIDHGARTAGEWPICHGVSRRAFNERGESGIRNILKPATSGNPSAASADTKARTAADTSPLINRLIAFV